MLFSPPHPPTKCCWGARSDKKLPCYWEQVENGKIWNLGKRSTCGKVRDPGYSNPPPPFSNCLVCACLCNLGGDLAQPRRPGHGIQRLTPRRPPWVSHDGTGRAPPGGGGKQVSPGSPCGPALPRLVCPPPQCSHPRHRASLHRYVMGGGRIRESPARSGVTTQWPSVRGLMSRGATGPALRCNAGQL